MEEWAQTLSQHIWSAPLQRMQYFDEDKRAACGTSVLDFLARVFRRVRYKKVKES